MITTDAEWENFEETIIEKLESDFIPSDLLEYAKLSIYRGIELNILGKIHIPLNFSKGSELINDETTAGEFAKEFTIFGCAGHYRYTMHNCYITSETYTQTPWLSLSGTYEITLVIDSITKELIEPSKSTILVLHEWYVTGKWKVHFPYFTEWYAVENDVLLRFRKEVDVLSDYTDGKSIKAASRNYTVIKFLNYTCILSIPHKSHLSDWEYKLNVEYYSNAGDIPSNELRESFISLVGFVMGGAFYKMGESLRNESDKNVTVTYNTPRKSFSNIKKKIHLPPVYIASAYAPLKWWELIEQLLPKYLENQNNYHLNYLIAKFEVSKDLNLGLEIPIYSSILESIAKLLYKHTYYATNKLMKQKDFEELIGPELMKIREKIKDHPSKELIIDRIKRASEVNPSEVIKYLFTKLEITPSEQETRALRSRNKLIHDSQFNIDEKTTRKLITHKRSYETLLNRIFLKLIGYNDKYIDYGITGHPRKDITLQ